MIKKPTFILNFLFLITLVIQAKSVFSETPPMPDLIKASVANKPLITPEAPIINAKAFILIDTHSGKVIAEKNSEQKLPPASLTKMMTLYVISNALKQNQISLKSMVPVSNEAWKIGGSRMFIKEGQSVSVEDLLKGIIVDSGNDACIAMAEYLGGSENSFSNIMNQFAQNLGMKNSHFTDSTGLPNPDHYTTAKDLAILGRALVNDFPQYYPWYKQKWFTYNGIRQPNRNRLLWRNKQVDGIKTGHTDEAGFCLVSSAKHDNMRLLAVVLGAPTDASRADDSERLLNYGFRFFETHELYKANQAITKLPLYKGLDDSVSVGLHANQYITVPNGQYQKLHITTNVPHFLQAPIKKGQNVGELMIKFEDKILSSIPLYALEAVPSGSMYKRMKDSLRLTFKGWFGS